MSEQPKETLSALMDNESSDFELRRVLERMAGDEELGQRWRRYHITRSVLKQDEVGSAVDISTQVMAVIDREAPLAAMEEPEPQHKRANFRRAILKPFASMAVAASVTAIVILGAQQSGVGQADVVPVSTAQTSAFVLPAVTPTQNFMQAQFGRNTASVLPRSEPDIIRLNQGLDQYILQHQTLLTRQSPSANPGWLPEGYQRVQNAVAPGADLTVFSNGKNAFTVCVEPVGNQVVPEGATQVGDMVAVGKRVDNRFITVVGDVPLMVADRIASSLTKN